MAMTLRLSADEDANLTRLASTYHSSKSAAVVTAIDLATPRPNHPEFVRAATDRLLQRYAALFARLAEA